MTDEDAKKMAELQNRYAAAAHAMQSATALQIERLGERGAAADPKHLRVGVNSAMVDGGAMAELLVKKGLITDLEYLEAITLGMEREAQIRGQETRTKLGLPDSVTFG